MPRHQCEIVNFYAKVTQFTAFARGATVDIGIVIRLPSGSDDARNLRIRAREKVTEPNLCQAPYQRELQSMLLHR